MAVKEILLLGNPVLRQKSEDVTTFNDELDNLIKDLKDTLIDFQERKKIGRAIAAPQIGALKKVIYIHMPGRSMPLINPRIVEKSEKTIDVWDSCFSFDVAFFVLTKRHRTIKVRYQNEKGIIIEEIFTDDLSELLQHEIDHLHGILATDYLTGKNHIIMRAEWEKRR